MHRGFKYRIYPNEEQQTFIRNCCDASRFIYNYALGNTKRRKEAADKVLEEYVAGLTMSDKDRELAEKMLKSNAKAMNDLVKKFSDAELGEQIRDKIKSGRYYYNKYEFSKEVRRLDKVMNDEGEYKYPFLCKGRIDKGLINYALEDLQLAFENMSKTGTGYPQFKNRHKCALTYTTQKVVGKNNVCAIDDKFVKLPGMDLIKMVYHRPIEGTIKTATVSITKSGQYYVSLCCDCPDITLKNGGEKVGIDVGLKEFYSDSKGNVVENPKFYKKSHDRLVKEQRKLNHMIESHIVGYKKGSKGGRVPIYDRPLHECKNIQKQKLKVAKISEHIARQREYFHDVESRQIARENELVCVEDLNVKGMQKNHKLALSIADAGWYNFTSKIEYKVKEYGGEMVRVPTFYPSSQLCSNCGYKNKDVKNLKIRVWTCPSCGIVHNRDINAGKNILAKGIEILEGAET